ncbi:relaxase [Parasedimentitalea marina]|uniref:Relaxase n=1 Tax=Parasedimentitalea marina TaxID=2483033 RepID=A0A3T0N606_9RHOB|nr:relaxase/mobilization nuclease domain-containing protein [Parasedimentitalea marina]AZV79425.1 relaxase [Parasedimentitalea marina]
MILKASQRGNPGQLSKHLLNSHDNEHVELYEVRGFMAEDLETALSEAEAISKGTRCKKFLFSLSLSPPEKEVVSIEAFEAAIEMTEQNLGLDNQPRAIVFHEKEGRRHAHVVWSRIDPESMTARTQPFYKNRLMDVSRILYLENEWDLPKGLIDRSMRNPLNMSREEWQQAKRTKQDPRLVKAMFRECWRSSDSEQALVSALKERGYTLARGDRRGVVAVDFRGEVLALARYADVKSKDIKDRIPEPEKRPSVDQAKAQIAVRMTEQLNRYIKEAESGHRRISPSLEMRRQRLVERQKAERKQIADQHKARQVEETCERAARLPKGLGGLWNRKTGKYGKIRSPNEYEAQKADFRDRAEKDDLIAGQLEER